MRTVATTYIRTHIAKTDRLPYYPAGRIPGSKVKQPLIAARPTLLAGAHAWDQQHGRPVFDILAEHLLATPLLLRRKEQRPQADALLSISHNVQHEYAFTARAHCPSRRVQQRAKDTPSRLGPIQFPRESAHDATEAQTGQ
jgi:hypothetical protein